MLKEAFSLPLLNQNAILYDIYNENFHPHKKEHAVHFTYVVKDLFGVTKITPSTKTMSTMWLSHESIMPHQTTRFELLSILLMYDEQLL